VTKVEQPDGKAGLERLWLLVVLAVAYTVSMVIIVAVARPNDHSVWTAAGVLLLLATEVTIAVLSWRDIVTFGGLMPWGRIPIYFRIVLAAGLIAAAAVLWVPLLIIAPVVQIVRGFVDLARAKRWRAARRQEAQGDDSIADVLAAELDSFRDRVPAEIWAKVDAIRQAIVAILARAQDLDPEELFVVRRTAVDYLPATLRNYVRLPEEYATNQPIAPGMTAYALLNEDLDLLESKLEDISDAIRHKDSDALVAHTRFLEEKFGRSSLTLPNA
jgi:hypothetical protein